MNRKAKLLAELEVAELEVAPSTLDSHNPGEDFEAALDDRMQKMIAVREKMFTSAASNIKDAQTWYKKDYDKKRSHSEVYYCCLH